MILVNTETIPGTHIRQMLGLVHGNTVRAKHFGRDMLAGLRNMVGGEMKTYTELLTHARQEAIARMIDQAQSMGANAIVNVRFSTSTIAAGAAEIHAYGTAVILELDEISEPDASGADTIESRPLESRTHEIDSPAAPEPDHV